MKKLNCCLIGRVRKEGGAEVENMRSWEAEKISTSQLPNLFLFSFFVPGEPPTEINIAK